MTTHTPISEEELIGISVRVGDCNGDGDLARHIIKRDAPRLIAEVRRLRAELEITKLPPTKGKFQQLNP